MPFSAATHEAIDALIRHPAAGLRYYQRVCRERRRANGLGPPPRGYRQYRPRNRGFSVYLCRGRRAHVLSGIYPGRLAADSPASCHLIHRLPKATSSRFITKVLVHVGSTAFRDMVWAPFGLIGTTWRKIAERRSFQEEAVAAKDYVFADIGARISVREIGSASSPRTFLQRLDAAKYTKIIERLVTDTVFDFLVDNGVDTSAYQESASAVNDNNYNIAGNVHAQENRW